MKLRLTDPAWDAEDDVRRPRSATVLVIVGSSSAGMMEAGTVAAAIAISLPALRLGRPDTSVASRI